MTAMVCAKPSRYFGRLPWFAPWWNQRASPSGSSAGSWSYFALLANSITVFGLSTPSRCSCNRTLGRLFNTPRSSFIEASGFLVRRDHCPQYKTMSSGNRRQTELAHFRDYIAIQQHCKPNSAGVGSLQPIFGGLREKDENSTDT